MYALKVCYHEMTLEPHNFVVKKELNSYQGRNKTQVNEIDGKVESLIAPLTSCSPPVWERAPVTEQAAPDKPVSYTQSCSVLI